MGWDGTIKPPSRRTRRIEERKGGILGKEKHHKTIVCSAYSTSTRLGVEVGRKGRGIGENDAARGGIRNQVEGGRHTVSKAGSGSGSGSSGHRSAFRDNNTTRHDYCVDTRHHRQGRAGRSTHPLRGGAGTGAGAQGTAHTTHRAQRHTEERGVATASNSDGDGDGDKHARPWSDQISQYPAGTRVALRAPTWVLDGTTGSG